MKVQNGKNKSIFFNKIVFSYMAMRIFKRNECVVFWFLISFNRTFNCCLVYFAIYTWILFKYPAVFEKRRYPSET